MKHFLLASCLGFALLPLSGQVMAEDIETKQVTFKPGKTVTMIKGALKGRQTIDYSVHAQAGQTMRVSFKAGNRSAYFNVLPPGSTGEAIFIGSTSGDEWSGKLTADGDYKIRTYLMRNAARRNEATHFTLTIGLSSDLGTAPASDAKVKGTPYHATGSVPCSAGTEAAGAKQCEFGVIRGKAGNAEVHVTYPPTNKRLLTFMGDKVTTDGKLKATKTGDVWSIEVNDAERYQIPDAVVSGG
jgi:hypothetical protein